MKKSILLPIVLLSVGYSVRAQNTAYGTSAGTGGTNNSFFGYYSGNVANSSSADNSFLGYYSGKFTTSGIRNSAVGSSALYNNTTGNYNNAFGFYSLYSNTTGAACDAFGYGSLYSNTSGGYNAGFGHRTLYLNTTGNYNVAIGLDGLLNNTSGSYNTGMGYYALRSNSTASDNTAIGFYSMYNTTAAGNTAVGSTSLFNNTTGTDNTAIGFDALYNVFTGSDNVGIGYNAGPNGDYFNTVCIGYNSTATGSDQVRLGNSSTTSIGGQVGWSNLSDGRFKTNIKEDISGLEFIKQLRPVSYLFDANAFDSFIGANSAPKGADTLNQRANHKVNSTNATPVRQTGFIAQEVEATMKKLGVTFSGLVAPQNEKDHYSLRYADFVVPLVKAVQEFNAEMASQQNKIDSLNSKINDLANQKKTSSVSNSSSVVLGNNAVLNQNTPNPFSINTQITMTIPDGSRVASLFIYNMQGVQLKSVQITSRGNVSINISAGELTAGMYLYTLVVDGQMIDTKRMILTN